MRIDDGLRLVRPPADHEASDDSSQHLMHRPNARTMYERRLNRNLKRDALAGLDAVRRTETAQTLRTHGWKFDAGCLSFFETPRWRHRIVDSVG